MWSLLIAVASAHPFQPSAWSMRTSVKAEADTVHVVVTLEAPTFRVLRSLVEQTGATTDGFNKAEVEKARDDFNDATWSALANGLTVRVDGRPQDVPFAPVDTPINGKANNQFFLYLVEGTWPIPAGTDQFTVQVRNTAFATEEMYLTAEPVGRTPWTVDDASSELLLRIGECPLDEDEDAEELLDVDDEGEVWLKDDRLRTLNVAFTR